MKEYLLKLLELCSDENFGQEAVEYGVVNGRVPLTYDLQTDLRTIMGEPGRPETGCYDQLCAAYRAVVRQNTETLTGLYEHSGLLAAIVGLPAGAPADWKGHLAAVRRDSFNAGIDAAAELAGQLEPAGTVDVSVFECLRQAS